MAYLFDKPINPPVSGFDRTLILQTREALVYPMPYEDWNTMRIGFLHSSTSDSTDDNIPYPRSTTFSMNVIDNIRDRFYFGLKDNDSNFPAQNQTPFIGQFNSGSQTQYFLDGTSTACPVMGLGYTQPDSLQYSEYGTIHKNGAFECVSGPRFDMGNKCDTNNVTNYGVFYIMNFTVLNKGLSNQQINIKTSTTEAVAKMTDVQIKNLMVGASFTDRGTYNYNLAGTPYKLPTSIFMYQPMSMWRLRVHQIAAIKIL